MLPAPYRYAVSPSRRYAVFRHDAMHPPAMRSVVSWQIAAASRYAFRRDLFMLCTLALCGLSRVCAMHQLADRRGVPSTPWSWQHKARSLRQCLGVLTAAAAAGAIACRVKTRVRSRQASQTQSKCTVSADDQNKRWARQRPAYKQRNNEDNRWPELLTSSLSRPSSPSSARVLG